MTMRLDIVTNDAGELVRREHARELGSGVVVAIYRLAKLAQMHDLGNQAFTRQLEQTHQMIGEYCLRSGSNVSVLFAHKATFVAGQLLKGNRGAYEAAAELGALLEKLGGSELQISRDVTREDCYAFAEQVSAFHRSGNASRIQLPPRIHLRQVADAARLRGIELENLSSDQRIVRAYASAVVIMRRFFEDLAASRYVLPRRIKRIAQSLVDLSDASTASYLGVTEVRNANYDEAGRAVNTAILAVSIARESTTDRTTLAQIAMAAMMHDVARPRALALAGAAGGPMPGMAGPTTLSEDQEDRLAAGAAAVLTALGRVNEPSITRTVLAFEALWLRRRTWLGPVYWGARGPTLHASVIAIARRYNDLLTPEPGLMPPTTDYAVAMLANELTDPQDRTVLRMLVSALGLLPSGTVVQLSTGEVAEVTKGARALGERPHVKIIADAHGAQFPNPAEIDLAHDARRIHRVLSVDGWRKGLEGAPQADQAPDSDGDIHVSVPPPAASPPPPPPPPAPPAPAPVSPISPVLTKNPVVRPQSSPQWSREEAARKEPSSISSSSEHPSSASMPSLGSSPSAVAEAMGRMINDSLAPPAFPPREADRPDRTVFQPHGQDDRPGRRVTSSAPREPTARGNLAATPLPHVLVYMLDHALTGSVVFESESGSPTDSIYFVNGVPAKIRLVDAVALLGELLQESRSLDARTLEQAVEGARHLGILLGEYLVGHDIVTRDALAIALEHQLLRKIAHVANLAPEIQYAYYRDIDLLSGWGGEIVVGHPLNPILASVRHWTDRGRVRATLNRIGKHPLALHPDSDLTNLALLPEEEVLLENIRTQAVPLPQVFRQKLADEEVVSSLVYSLAVTRQFAFKGQKKGPMAARGPAWRSVAPSSQSKAPVASGAVSSAPSGGVTSGSRPAMAAPASAKSSASVAAAPPVQVAAEARAPSVATRAAAPQVGSAPPRAMAPAVRPANTPGARPAGPQIRPIAKKQGTIMGLQPAQPPSVRPGPSSSAPKAPHADDEFDNAKTIALTAPMSPAEMMKRVQAAKAKAAAASQGPASVRPPPSAKPPPPPPPPPAPGYETPSSVRGSLDDEWNTEPVQVPPPPGTMEIGDAGIADAEAALEAMTSFRLAEAALQRNDLAAAEEHARKAVAGDSMQLDYVTLLAWVRCLKGGSPDEAIRAMSKVLIEDPANESALLYRARLLVRTNRLVEALNDYTELTSTNPHHREAQAEARQLMARLPPS